MSLNEGKLSEYLNILLNNKTISKKYYEEHAIVRNQQFLNEIISAIKKLETNIQFRLFIKSGADLDKPNYWETVYLFLYFIMR